MHGGSGKSRRDQTRGFLRLPGGKTSYRQDQIGEGGSDPQNAYELLLAHAPDAFELQDLARSTEPTNRFEKEASFCIHCGLCVRYCAEVKKKNAVGFVDRGIRKEISFIPEIASKECWDCKECFPLCPTEALQAAYVLVEAFAFPKSSSSPENKKGTRPGSDLGTERVRNPMNKSAVKIRLMQVVDFAAVTRIGAGTSQAAQARILYTEV